MRTVHGNLRRRRLLVHEVLPLDAAREMRRRRAKAVAGAVRGKASKMSGEFGYL
jgi:hypothetical protein